MPDKINCGKIINHWIKSSQHDFETAEFLFKGKKYPECLFFCHLMIEKILKGLVVVKTKKQPPYIHYLDKLVIETGLDFTEEQMNQFKIITTFNIRARYDNYKSSFYKKCDKQYTKKYFDISKKLYLWLEKQYPKK